MVADHSREPYEPDVPLSTQSAYRRPPPPSHPAPLPYASFLVPPPPPPLPPPPTGRAGNTQRSIGRAAGGSEGEGEAGTEDEIDSKTSTLLPKQHSSFNAPGGQDGPQTQTAQQFPRHNSLGALGSGSAGVGLGHLSVSSSGAYIGASESPPRSSDALDSVQSPGPGQQSSSRYQTSTLLYCICMSIHHLRVYSTVRSLTRTRIWPYFSYWLCL